MSSKASVVRVHRLIPCAVHKTNIDLLRFSALPFEVHTVKIKLARFFCICS